MRRAYIAETEILPGRAVVQGSEDNKVMHPDVDGGGDFIGVYAWECNAAKDGDERVGIELHGLTKVEAGGTVRAGKKAMMKNDASGLLVEVPEAPEAAPGVYLTCGTFLESGAENEIVDFFVERGSVTIEEEVSE